MTLTPQLLIGAAALMAAVDWYSVAVRRRTLERISKPAVMLALIAAAAMLDPASNARRWAFVIALIASLAGDVFLMFDKFVPGLLSFFFAHVAYIVGLRIDATGTKPLIVAAVVVVTVSSILGRRILEGVRSREPEFATPVSAYIAVISVMTACALASGVPLAATGAVLFMVSDSLIAWNRFVASRGWMPVTIMVTYHLAQAGLVASLMR